MDPLTHACAAAAARLRNFTLSVSDLDITRPGIVSEFRGVTFKQAVLLAADAVEDAARRFGVSVYALDYSMKEAT